MANSLWTRRMALGGVAGAALLAAAPAIVGRAVAQTAFDWKKYAGTDLDVLLVKKPANDLFVQNLAEFADLTGINASIEIVPEQQHRQKLVIEMSTGNPTFDVSELSLNVQKRIAAKGKWFTDLKPMIADPAMTSLDFDFADFSQGGIDFATQMDGTMDTMPYGLDYFLLYYNKEMFETKGVALPTSMDDMVRAAKELNDPANGVAGFVSRGLKNANVPVWMNLLFGYGGEAIDASGKLLTTSPEAVASATLYQTLNKDYGPPGVVGFNFAECQTTFSQGFAAMWLDSTAWARPLENSETSKIAGKVGYMPVPPGPKGASSAIFASSLGIAAKSDKKEAAWYFVQWATNKLNQTRLLQSGVGSSARKSPFADPETVSKSPLPKEYFDTMVKCIEIGHPGLPNIIPVTEFRDTFGVALSNMITGADPATELQAATAAFQPILDASEK